MLIDKIQRLYHGCYALCICYTLFKYLVMPYAYGTMAWVENHWVAPRLTQAFIFPR